MEREVSRLISANDLQRQPYEFSRTRAYELLNDSRLPIIRIGRRKYLHGPLFEKWLEDLARQGENNAR